MLRILRLGSERIICVVSVSIDNWCCVEPTGKISVVPWLDVMVVWHIVWCMYNSLDDIN